MRKSLLALAAAFASASQAHAQAVQADPQGSSALLAGVTWLQGTLMGNVATAVAVMADAMKHAAATSATALLANPESARFSAAPVPMPAPSGLATLGA